MRNIYLSVNQLAEFSEATQAKKLRIISQQKQVNKFLVPWYQMAKASIRKSIRLHGDIGPINEAIEYLNNKTIENKRQRTDRSVSIEALQRYLSMRLPTLLQSINYEVVKIEKGQAKSIVINGVEVIVSPEIIFKGIHNNKKIAGGIKLHVSKNKPFGFSKCSHVSTLIYQYLEEYFKNYDEQVVPELCFCLDIFNNRFFNLSASQIKKTENIIWDVCEEVRRLWDAA